MVNMTQTICVHPPVQLATDLEILRTEQISEIHEGPSRRHADKAGFCSFFMNIPVSNTLQTDSIYCFIARDGHPGF